MKVSELIEELQKAPQDVGVMIDCAGRLTEINHVGADVRNTRGMDQSSAVIVLRGALGSISDG